MDKDQTTDDLIRRIARLDIWSGRVELEPLAGGLTNKNFFVRDGNRTCVVRTGGDILVHGIVRANELAAARAAHHAGLSPAVLYAEPGLTVIQHIEGRTFTPDDVRDARNLLALVDLIRCCHRDVAKHLRGPAPMFWPFHVIRDYAHTLTQAGSVYSPQIARLLARSSDLEHAVGPIDVVFGHNDLLAANIMDDGERLWLLDWEYAGFNSPLFDLGGLSSNSEMSDEMTEALLSAYFSCDVDSALRRKAAAMTAASLLRETMWAMVSEIHSTVDFDYAAYTAENLRRFELADHAFQILDPS